MTQEQINKLKVYKYLLSKDTLTRDEFDMIVTLSVMCEENNISCNDLNNKPEPGGLLWQ